MQFLAPYCVIWVGDIADGEDLREDLAEPDPLRIPAHARRVAGVVEIDVDHAVATPQDPLVQPQAGGAADVFQQQGALAQPAAIADEGCLDLGMVVER